MRYEEPNLTVIGIYSDNIIVTSLGVEEEGNGFGTKEEIQFGK